MSNLCTWLLNYIIYLYSKHITSICVKKYILESEGKAFWTLVESMMEKNIQDYMIYLEYYVKNSSVSVFIVLYMHPRASNNLIHNMGVYYCIFTHRFPK